MEVNTIEYRLATYADAKYIYEMVQDTIKQVYPKYYLPEIVDMFCAFHNEENIVEDIRNGKVCALLENNRIIGTGTIKKIILQGYMYCRIFRKKDLGLLL